MNRCAERGHRFQKFDDESLFCERCGERRVIAAKTYWPDWTYHPPVIWPNTWYPRWYPPYFVWSSGTSDMISDDYTTFNGTLTTGSVSMATNAIAGPQTATPRGVKRT